MPTFHSFEQQVLPELNRRGHRGARHEAASAGTASRCKKGVLTAEEALRYAMSLPGHHHDHRHGEAGSGAPEPEGRAGVSTDGRSGDGGSARAVPANRRRRPLRALQDCRSSMTIPEARLAHDFPLDEQVQGSPGNDAGHPEHGRSVPEVTPSIGRSKSMSTDFTPQAASWKEPRLATGGSTDGARASNPRRDIPKRPLGRTGLQTSIIGAGRLPSGSAKDLSEASALSTRPSTRASTSSTTPGSTTKARAKNGWARR